MGAIITIFGLKGGQGRTTTSLSLYKAYQNKGVSSIGLLDMDRQKSLKTLNSTFKLNLNVYDFEQFNEAKDNTLLIVDTPPYFDNDVVKVLKLSHFIILPTKPYPMDAVRLIDSIKVIKQEVPKTKAYVLFTQLITGSKYSNDVISKIKGYGLPLLASTLNHRIAYSKSTMTGDIYKTGDKKAISEVNNLANEVYTLLMIDQ